MASPVLASAALAACLGSQSTELAIIAAITASELAQMTAEMKVGFAVDAETGQVFAPGATLPPARSLFVSLRVTLPQGIGHPGDVLSFLASLAGNGWKFESLPILVPALDHSLPVIRARPHDLPARTRATAAPEQTGVTDGTGVLLGVVDFGCDFAHPAFLDEAGQTRLEFLWDQNAAGMGSVPGLFHERAVIQAALASSDPYDALDYRPDRNCYVPAASQRDNLVHGTHVMGVAAGRLTKDCPAGVAPGATLAFVHLRPGALVTCGDPADVFDGVCAVFLRAEALGVPAVVNLSLGANTGSHDGNTVYDLALDALLSKPGRGITVAAGNERQAKLNADGEVAAGKPVTLCWNFNPGDQTQNTMRIFSDAPGSEPLVECSVLQDGTNLGGPIPEGVNAAWLVQDGSARGMMYSGLAPTRGGGPLQHIEIRFRPSGEAEQLHVVLSTASGPVRFDAWIDRDDRQTASQSCFDQPSPQTSSTLVCTACGSRTVCVGAFDHRDAEFAPAAFSAEGLTRDMRQRPDVCAPGLEVSAAAAYGGRTLPGDVWRQPFAVRMSGTSAAAPHVAGIVALMLEIEPTLHADVCSRILRETSHLDPAQSQTGWHPQLGSGRVDAAAALARLGR